MEWYEIAGPGQLVSYSTLIYAPTGFEEDLPYTIAVVQFGEDIKVFGRLSKEIKAEEVTVGMKLDVTPVELPNGRISYEFREA